MRRAGLSLAPVLLSAALIHPAVAQQATQAPDSARTEIRAVLRAFYLNLESRNWDALAAYVLSPKLLERRGAPGDLQMVARDRSRSRGWSHAAAGPVTCPSSTSSGIEAAAIRVDGDWADVSVPRCSGTASGVDELGLLYFERRWRFIYTDLFEGPATTETAKR
ncbi:MAG TPA: hypothetical protein VJQ46_06325 [Gemmatimonadales bacterium]|nr:hypothetical protein [Gemmatimonadales bacterium]